MISRFGAWLSSIPRIWRFTLGSIVFLAASMSAIILGVRLTQTGYACLYLNGDGIGVLEINSGHNYSYPTWTPTLSTSWNGPYVLSPDKKRIAYFKGPDSTELTVQNVSRPIPANKESAYFTGYDETASDILWSPDERLIAYHWTVETGPDSRHYVAIADANGHLLRQTELAVAPDDAIGFDSWSADETYIALINNSSQYQSMAFLSVSDLKLIDAGTDAHQIGASCGFRGYGRAYCHPWNYTGHGAAYTITQDYTRVSLVMIVPGATSPRVFDLPYSAIQTVKWSPKGNFVAVASFAFGANNAAKDARLDIFGTDGTVYPNVGRVVEANLDVTDTTIYAEMQWSPDGKSLYYARFNPTNTSRYDIVRYRVDTGQTSVLLSAPSGGSTETFFYFAPNGETAAFYLGYGDLYIVSMQGNVLAHFRTPSLSENSIVWSPDSTRLIYALYDSIGYHEIINVVSNTGRDLGQFAGTWFTYAITWTRCDVP